MQVKRIISLICVLALVIAVSAGCGGAQKEETAAETTKAEGTAQKQEETSETATTSASAGELPRNETLYFNGLQWGAPTNFNTLTSDPSFPVQVGQLLMYETLFMYNQLTGEIEPLLGKSYTWADDYTIKVELNEGTHWNDGQPLTADDIVYTFMLGKKYTVRWSSTMDYIDEVVAESPTTVVFKLNQKNYNRLNALHGLADVQIIPKHIWEPIEIKSGNKIEEMRKEFNPNPVASGAYKMMAYDDTKIVLQRDDNYWGKSLFGKLPAPKYIVHNIFKSNDAGSNAFRNGEVDVSQQFIPKVWELWKNGAPYKTYLDEPPYYIPGTTPMITINMTKKGLDVPEVRKAIAMCIDYKKIGEVAMSGYTDPIEPSITLNTPAEKKFIDESQIKALQWTTDVEGANKLLDSIGAKPGPDGIRVLKDGTRLGPYELECPYGWTDWNASLEIVALCAKKIGIEMRTKFPETPVWLNDRATGKFDIIMESPSAANIAMPWDRARYMMKSEGVPPVGETAFYNFGRFKNARADELIKLIPTKKDENELKLLYTELNKIYLENIPTIQLMYRPSNFYTVCEKVWKGFPDAKNNPKNIPPTPINGAFIKVLYEISAD